MKTLILGSTVLDMIINIDHLPALQEAINTHEATLSLGGMAYNVNGMMQHFKCETLFGCPVGKGTFSDVVKGLMEKSGIQAWCEVENQDNGVCLCLVDKSGERSFVSCHGAEYLFSEKWFEDIDFSLVDWVYVSGLEVEEKTGEELVCFLEKINKPIFFAPGPRILQIPKERMERIMRLNTLVHLNEKEACSWTNETDYQKAAELIYQKTQQAVIVTLAERGAWLKSEKEEVLILSRKANVVDTIGAGDGHAGTVLAMLQKGIDLKKAVQIANVVSSWIVEKKGAGLDEQQFNKVRGFCEDNHIMLP